jgi:hypothetical protein
MRKSIAQQIAETSRSLREAKPRSHLRIKLEIRLRDLVVKQLKREMRAA